MSKRILVTGGAGFIGSAVVRHVIDATDYEVLVFDKLTYAGNLDNLEGVSRNPRYRFVRGDICDRQSVHENIFAFRPDVIMHLAAESHVDRSIDGPGEFIKTNVLGTFELLQAAREYWSSLAGADRKRFRFHHISTDEVFGSLGETGAFTEESPYAPNSPYAASKASSDHLVRAWHYTYGLPVVLSNCSNNYGPFHFPEKLIPLMILNICEGKPLPVYGKGRNVRDWLYVEDHAKALLMVAEAGRLGESYNIGGNSERTNLAVVEKICDLMDKITPDPSGRPNRRLITFVDDRPGHDLRYAIDCSKITKELGWTASETFDSGMRKTIDWYLLNRNWWERIRKNSYRGERLGLSTEQTR